MPRRSNLVAVLSATVSLTAYAGATSSFHVGIVIANTCTALPAQDQPAGAYRPGVPPVLRCTQPGFTGRVSITPSDPVAGSSTEGGRLTITY